MDAGSKNLITDVAGLRVGNAQDETLKSGSTVLTADHPFTAGVHVMGGAPGTRETDLLAPDKSVAKVDALVLSGGSAFGLDACSGVMDGLLNHNRGYRVMDAIIPLVPGAILFDLLNGGNKKWHDNPYRALGRRAYDRAGETFRLGSVGAGTGALSANVKGGLGSASVVLPNGITVGALVAANPVGSVITPNTQHFWAAPFEIDAEFGNKGVDQSGDNAAMFESIKVKPLRERANTTIAIVATDMDLSKAQCQRLAMSAHDGIARAIVPSHLPNDGDCVFALSTNEKNTATADEDFLWACHGAAVCLSRAIARAIYEATPSENDILPTWKTLHSQY